VAATVVVRVGVGVGVVVVVGVAGVGVLFKGTAFTLGTLAQGLWICGGLVVVEVDGAGFDAGLGDVVGLLSFSAFVLVSMDVVDVTAGGAGAA
jgi:hypothetical protein